MSARGSTVWLVCCSALVGAAACAPRDAGFAAVKTSVRERIGHEPRYRDVEGDEDAATARQLQAWLARPLDAETAVKIALLRNPQLQAAFTRLGVARASLLGASLPPDLELSAHVGFPEGGGSPHLTFEATESLTGLIALPLRRAQASAALVSAQTLAASDALDVAYRTRQAFYAYQAAEQEAALLRDVAAAAHLTTELIDRLRTAGNVTELELAEARAFEQETQIMLDEAELDRLDRRTALWQWLGGPANPANLHVASHLPEVESRLPPLAEVERRALTQSLELRRLRAEQERFAREETVAKVQGLLPDLRAGVHVERDHGEWEFGPAASVGLPLFDHGQAQVDAAEAGQRSLAFAQQAHALAVRAAAVSLCSQLEVSAARVRRYAEALLPLRRTIVEQTLRQYNAMQIGVAQLLVARTSELAAGRAYVAALRSYWLLRSELDQLLAGRLMDEMPGASDAMGSIAAPSMGAVSEGGH